MASRKKGPETDRRQLGLDALWAAPAKPASAAPPAEVDPVEVAFAFEPFGQAQLFAPAKVDSTATPERSAPGDATTREADLFENDAGNPAARDAREQPRRMAPMASTDATASADDLFGSESGNTATLDAREQPRRLAPMVTASEGDLFRNEAVARASGNSETRERPTTTASREHPLALGEAVEPATRGNPAAPDAPTREADLFGNEAFEDVGGSRTPAAKPTITTPPAPASPPLAKVIRLPTARTPSAPPPPPPEPSPPRALPALLAEAPEVAYEPENTDEIPLPEGLRLERNLALLAGAGAGKTYSLVTMCLHLVSGARAGFEPIDCSQLGLLTFTDKAAGEMRGRLRERLDALARGIDREVELRASFAALEREFPPVSFWRKVRDELGAASIGTFHSLCTQLLRRAPPSAQLNPNFELLDDRQARRLVREVIERVLLRRVQDGHREVRALVSELGFGGSSTTTGLVDALAPVFTRIREEGLSPEYVNISDPLKLRRQFDAALQQLRGATKKAFSTATKLRDRLDRFDRILKQLTFENVPEQVPKLRAELSTLRTEPFNSLKPFVRTFKREDGGADVNLALLHGACVMAPHEAAIRDVLTEVAWEHRQLLDRLGVLDFTGLLVHARDLLRDSLDARREAQARFKALLVDEFQDTNRLQLELVLLLSEKREGAPRPVSTAFEAQHHEITLLPLEPAFTAVVGDRKQAIYEFRGADVSVFEAMAQCLERNDGGRAYLRHSRRSSPSLVKALNTTMARVLGAEKYASPAREFEVVYAPRQDDLVPVRTREAAQRPYVRLAHTLPEKEANNSEQLRLADADAVARWVADLLTRRTQLIVPRADDQPLRPVRGSDVALLFQRFTQLETYRQALVQHGVRHRVVRGRGFFGAQEVVDLASFLNLLARPDDPVSFAAVLRSPLVGLSDTSLVELALPTASFAAGLRGRDVLELGRRPLTAGPVELARLERLVSTWRTLSPERDRLGLRGLLRCALDGTGFRTAVAAGPFAEQALANLDKLLELATTRERDGVGVSAFAGELLELAEAEPTEAQGEVVDELDADAVTLCTVHQAKGLEWPIVVLPDLSASPNPTNSTVRFDRLAGLGVKPLTSDDGELQSFSLERITELRTARSNAERLRLLYVAMTRARDQVVFGLMAEKPRQGCWAADLQALFQWHDVRKLTDEVDEASLPRGVAAVDPAVPEAQAIEAARALVRRVRQAPPAQAQTVMVPVTHLQEFVSCPRRFHLAYQVGLSERPPSFDRPKEEDGDAAPVVADVRERGTAAHRLLELTPLEAVGTALQPTLEAIRRAEGLDAIAGEDVLEWVTRFWKSRFGASLPALTEARVHRELPFVLTLRDDDGFRVLLRGQIDLLVEAESGELVVVDYKTATMPPAGLEPYRFQLGCYALAAARFAGAQFEGVVRAGISFLRELDVEPRFLDSLPDLGALERSLAREAKALMRAQVDGHWPGRELPRCEALHCGFRYRCHPTS